MQTTNYLLPQTLISSNGWTTPQNILLDDGSYAISNATSTLTSELVVGNFLFNLPTNSIVSGIEIEIKGKRGPLTNPASTLQIYAYDNTNNNNALYQYTPVFSNIDTVDGVYTLGSNIYTFGQTLTAEQMNNLKFKLIANSEMYVDSFKVRVFYGEPSTGTLPVIDGACQTIIQAQKFSLVDNVSSTDTTILVSKFETPDGILITNTDIDTTQAAAGKGIPITVSHATRREENMYVTSIEHLTNGYTRLTVTRGWSFKQPIGQLVSRNKAHPVGNEVIISNSTPFYDEFLRKCDIGTLVSAPIKVEDESVNITNYLRSLNFIGAGVTAVSTPAITGGGHDVDVTITGYGNQPINITNVTSVTSGGNQVTTLSTNITTEGTDTALVVAISLEAGKTVTGVTYNSLPLLFGGAQNQNDVRVEVWYMANPSGGNHTITATFSSATYSCFEAASLSGVDQTTPFVSLIGNSGNSLLSTGSVTTLTPNSTFFHALATREVGMTYTAALGETLNSTSLSGAVQGALASKLVGTPSTQNSQINLSILNDWANLLFAIQPTPVLPPIITPGQVSIQFQDESINLGTTGTVDTVDFTGSGVTATRTGNKVTVNVTGGADEQVKVSATDTTTGYLDNKIELVSGTNTTVTKTILNPGANEKIRYQVNSTGGSGVSNTTTASYFQDFNGTQINSGSGGTVIMYGGLYSFVTQNSNTQYSSSFPGHPGVIEFITGGEVVNGVDLTGLDLQNLVIEGMFYFDLIIPNNALIINLNISSAGIGSYFQLYMTNIGGQQYALNGSSLSPCTYISGWNTFKVEYNSLGTSTSFYLNNVLVASGLPVSIGGSTVGTTQGNNSKIDYISINGTITR